MRSRNCRRQSWARFETPQPVTILGCDGDAMEPFVSRDRAVLFFNNRNEPPEQTDLHWAERIDDVNFRYRDRVEGANSARLDGVPTMSRDGRFCFVSPRAYDEMLATIHWGTWTVRGVSQVILQQEVSPHTRGQVVFDVELAADGAAMILAQGDFRGGSGFPRSANLQLARLIDGAFRLSPADDALFASVYTDELEYAGALSPDELELSFTRLDGSPPLVRTGIWLARRGRPNDAFSEPARIGAIGGFAEAATYSPDGCALYYHRRDRSRFSIWRALRRAC